MQVGLIGWRGMVGSVLVQRMREERDFDSIDPVFFSTSQVSDTGMGLPASSLPLTTMKSPVPPWMIWHSMLAIQEPLLPSGS